MARADTPDDQPSPRIVDLLTEVSCTEDPHTDDLLIALLPVVNGSAFGAEVSPASLAEVEQALALIFAFGQHLEPYKGSRRTWAVTPYAAQLALRYGPPVPLAEVSEDVIDVWVSYRPPNDCGKAVPGAGHTRSSCSGISAEDYPVPLVKRDIRCTVQLDPAPA